MSVSVVKGQKADLTKSNPGLTHVKVTLGWVSSAQIELDTSAFLLAPDGKVRGDNDLIFYGNPSNGYISYSEVGTNERQLSIQLNGVVPQVDKIAFTLTIYEGELRKQTFSQVNSVFIRFVNETTGQEILRYDLGHSFSVETAIVIGELYRYNGEWKFNAIGAGYSGGLHALCSSYGIETEAAKPAPPAAEKDKPAPPSSRSAHTDKPVPPAPERQSPPAPAAPPQPLNIKLSKIELKKKGEKINLEKKSGGLGEILINLNWNQQTKKSGFFGKTSTGVDLDLACLYELKNGNKGVVQALGDSFGSLNREPYIMLDGDDRTGAVNTGENIRINGSKVADIKRILVFTFIYKGVSNWSEADGIVTLKQNGGPDIVVKLDEFDSKLPMCAIAMIENQGDETFSIERIVRHFSGHKDLDAAYGWGMRWVAGSK